MPKDKIKSEKEKEIVTTRSGETRHIFTQGKAPLPEKDVLYPLLVY